MKRMSRVSRVATASCLVTMICAQDAAQSQQPSGADSRWAAMTKCAAILDDDSRHACSDDVLRSAGLLPAAEARSPERRKRFGLQPQAVMKQDEEDRLQVTLAAVEEADNGKLVLTTSDGAIWRQVESNAVRPRPIQGQSMTIAKTSLGGFMCKPGKWVAFRCFRAR